MEARSAAIAADSARVTARQRHALKLTVVRHKYAARIAVHAHAMGPHARKLLRLHAWMENKFIALACPDYEKHHIVCLDEHSSIA
jgi:hypothetical protein